MITIEFLKNVPKEPFYFILFVKFHSLFCKIGLSDANSTKSRQKSKI